MARRYANAVYAVVVCEANGLFSTRKFSCI